MAKITGSALPAGLPNVTTENDAPALADVPAIFASDLAAIYGAVSGADSIASNTENPAPSINGRKGHDHSGGYGGRPIFRTVYTLVGDIGEDSTDKISKNGQGLLIDWPISGYTIGPDESIVWTLPTRFVVYVPPGDSSFTYGAYAYLGIGVIVANTRTGGAKAGDTQYIRIVNETTGAEVDLSMTANVTTVQNLESTGSGDRLAMRVGAANILSVAVYYVADSTAGSRSGTDPIVKGLELGVHEDPAGLA